MPKKVDENLIKKLYLDGYTQREISYIVDCSVSTVNKVVKDIKPNTKFRDISEDNEEDIEKVIYYHRKGYPVVLISKLLRVKASKVLTILERYLEF